MPEPKKIDLMAALKKSLREEEQRRAVERLCEAAMEAAADLDGDPRVFTTGAELRAAVAAVRGPREEREGG